MGREARVKKERAIQQTDMVVYGNAKDVAWEEALIRRAANVGLILPRIVVPHGQHE
jgi:hypothetical protein